MRRALALSSFMIIIFQCQGPFIWPFSLSFEVRQAVISVWSVSWLYSIQSSLWRARPGNYRNVRAQVKLCFGLFFL